MSDRVKRSFRPTAEVVEDRCVATAHTLAAGAELQALAARQRTERAAAAVARLQDAATQRSLIQGRIQTQTPLEVNVHGSVGRGQANGAEIEAFRVRRRPAPPRWGGAGPVTGTPNGGMGLIRLGLPGGFLDYGVVSLWNNTNTTVTFGVSASTFRNGQTFFFTFRPGQNQSFYAPVVNGVKPLFVVRFNSAPNTAIPLPNQNIVFESPRYVPQGTAGWPYSIEFGVNGYFITTI